MIELEAEHVTEVFTGFGQLGVRAEAVAGRPSARPKSIWPPACRWANTWPISSCCRLGIAAYLGPGGGTFRTLALTSHARTHLDILRQFLGLEAEVEQTGSNECVVRIGAESFSRQGRGAKTQRKKASRGVYPRGCHSESTRPRPICYVKHNLLDGLAAEAPLPAQPISGPTDHQQRADQPGGQRARTVAW